MRTEADRRIGQRGRESIKEKREKGQPLDSYTQSEAIKRSCPGKEGAEPKPELAKSQIVMSAPVPTLFRYL